MSNLTIRVKTMMAFGGVICALVLAGGFSVLNWISAEFAWIFASLVALLAGIFFYYSVIRPMVTLISFSFR